MTKIDQSVSCQDSDGANIGDGTRSKWPMELAEHGKTWLPLSL